MDKFDVAVWVDDAVDTLLDGQDPELDRLSIADRQEIIARIREKSQELSQFANGGDGLLNKPGKLIYDYKKQIDALLGLSIRVDPGIAEDIADKIADALEDGGKPKLELV